MEESQGKMEVGVDQGAKKRKREDVEDEEDEQAILTGPSPDAATDVPLSSMHDSLHLSH
jgi:hypothetical protein